MSVEAPGTINTLDSSLPTSADLISEGDNHIRLIKGDLKLTFPNITGAVTPTHTELNYSVGLTGAIQGQLNALSASMAGYAPLASPTFTGIPRAPTAAPGSTGTQIATVDYANNLAFSAALPGFSGLPDGYIIQLINGTPMWAGPRIPDYVAMNAGVN